MKKSPTTEKIISTAAIKLDANERDLLSRWLTNDDAFIDDSEDERIHPIKYVDKMLPFEEISDVTNDCKADVLDYFDKHKKKIAKCFAKIDAEAEKKKREEDAKKESALREYRAAQEMVAKAAQEKRETEAREERNYIALQAAKRREIEQAEQLAQKNNQETALISEVIPATHRPTPTPKDNETTAFNDLDYKPRRVKNLEVLLRDVSNLCGYSDSDDLKTNDPSLYHVVNNICANYRWKKAILIDLNWQTENIHKPSSFVFDKVIYAKLTHAQKAHADSKSSKTVFFQIDKESVTKENALILTLQFLIENGNKDYTYNQIAKALGTNWNLISQACQQLVKDGKSGVVKFVKNTNKGTSEVYRYVPLRKEIETGMSKSEDVIRKVLLSLISDNPGQNGRQLKDETRKEIVSMADHTFRFVLTGLIESGKVVVKPGLRRSNLHFIA